MSVLDKRTLPTSPAGRDTDELATALEGVTSRLYREFGRRHDRQLIDDLVHSCRFELSCVPVGALPELVERLARQRLQSGWASLLIER